MEETQQTRARPDRRAKLVTSVAVVLALLGVLLVPSGAAAIQENNSTGPLYANESTVVDNESWTEGRQDATLNNVTHYATRVGAFIVGSGQPGAEAIGNAGILLTGLVVLSIMLGATFGSSLGPVGGAALSIAAVSALTRAGLAPEWLYPVVLFLLGIVATAAFVRGFE